MDEILVAVVAMEADERTGPNVVAFVNINVVVARPEAMKVVKLVVVVMAAVAVLALAYFLIFLLRLNLNHFLLLCL